MKEIIKLSIWDITLPPPPKIVFCMIYMLYSCIHIRLGNYADFLVQVSSLEEVLQAAFPGGFPLILSQAYRWTDALGYSLNWRNFFYCPRNNDRLFSEAATKTDEKKRLQSDKQKTDRNIGSKYNKNNSLIREDDFYGKTVKLSNSPRTIKHILYCIKFPYKAGWFKIWKKKGEWEWTISPRGIRQNTSESPIFSVKQLTWA